MPVATEARTFSLATPGGRRRASLGLAATALVIGLAVGLGGPYLLSKPEPAEAKPSAAQDEAPVAAVPEPSADAAPDPAPEPETEPEEELTIVVEDEPEDAEPASTPPKPRGKTKRKKRRNKADKPASKPAASPGPSVPAEYLPPSRR